MPETFNDPQRGVDVTYNTTCPHCGAVDELYIVSGTFNSRIWLRPDGFSMFDGDVSTEDEVLECAICHNTSPLKAY